MAVFPLSEICSFILARPFNLWLQHTDILPVKHLMSFHACGSFFYRLVVIRYIKNISISLSISIYHIVSYRWKNVGFFDISWYSKISWYIAIFLIISRYFLRILYYRPWLEKRAQNAAS